MLYLRRPLVYATGLGTQYLKQINTHRYARDSSSSEGSTRNVDFGLQPIGKTTWQS